MANSKLERLKRMKAGNMLGEGELESITGGAVTEMNQDAFFFNKMGISQPAIGDIEEWSKTWASFGVTAVKDEKGKNQYSINGRPVNQGVAWKTARAAMNNPSATGTLGG